MLLLPTLRKLSAEEHVVSLHNWRLDGGDTKRRRLKTSEDNLVASLLEVLLTVGRLSCIDLHIHINLVFFIRYYISLSPLPSRHSQSIHPLPIQYKSSPPFHTYAAPKCSLIGIRMRWSDCAKLVLLEGSLAGCYLNWIVFSTNKSRRKYMY